MSQVASRRSLIAWYFSAPVTCSLRPVACDLSSSRQNKLPVTYGIMTPNSLYILNAMLLQAARNMARG